MENNANLFSEQLAHNVDDGVDSNNVLGQKSVNVLKTRKQAQIKIRDQQTLIKKIKKQSGFGGVLLAGEPVRKFKKSK